MFIKMGFRDDLKEILLNIDGKRFSDFGMMWGKLSELTHIGLDTLQSYDDWYILDDGFYYFKYSCIFEELFMSELSQECKVRCVEFKLAENSLLSKIKYPPVGILSKLYRTKDKKYYMYIDFCNEYFKHVPDNLGVFRLASSIAFGEENTQKLMEDIFGLICFDMFSGQWDREEYNLFFECGEDGIRLAPLCDNEMIFDKSAIYHSPFGDFSLSKLDDYKIYRENLLLLLEREKIFYERLVSLLNIDINEVLKRTIDKYRIIMDSDEKNKILRYFDDRKRAIEHTLKLSKNNIL